MLPSPEKVQIILPVVSFVFLACGFHRNIYGVIGYFIIMACRIGLLFPGLGAIRIELLAAGIVFISIGITGNGFSRVLHEKNRIHVALIGLTAVSFLSMLQAVNVSVSWELGFLEYIKVFLFYVMIICSIKNVEDLKVFTWAFILITAWIAYEPLANYFSGQFIDHGYGAVAIGSVGAAEGHVALANTLCQAIPIAIFYFNSNDNKATKMVLLVLIAFLIIGVILSKSRGGFIGLCAVALAIIYFSENRKKAIMLISILFILSSPFVDADFKAHMSTIRDGIHGSRSTSDRYLGLRNGIDMMIKRPLLGVGIGCYAEARRIYFSYYFYSHNLYGELFGELGLASGIWFLWIYYMFVHASHLKKNLSSTYEKESLYHNILNGIMSALFVRLLIGNFTHSAFIWFWFVMAALAVSVEYLVASERSKTESA